jgi:hypothetical protein
MQLQAILRPECSGMPYPPRLWYPMLSCGVGAAFAAGLKSLPEHRIIDVHLRVQIYGESGASAYRA